MKKYCPSIELKYFWNKDVCCPCSVLYRWTVCVECGIEFGGEESIQGKWIVPNGFTFISDISSRPSIQMRKSFSQSLFWSWYCNFPRSTLWSNRSAGIWFGKTDTTGSSCCSMSHNVTWQQESLYFSHRSRSRWRLSRVDMCHLSRCAARFLLQKCFQKILRLLLKK